mgnify:CR=1 FL=1
MLAYGCMFSKDKSRGPHGCCMRVCANPHTPALGKQSGPCGQQHGGLQAPSMPACIPLACCIWLPPPNVIMKPNFLKHQGWCMPAPRIYADT